MTREQTKTAFADELPVIIRALAVITKGNEEQDEAHVHDAALSQCMIAAGFCPNGCGNLKEGAYCPSCNFTCQGF